MPPSRRQQHLRRLGSFISRLGRENLHSQSLHSHAKQDRQPNSASPLLVLGNVRPILSRIAASHPRMLGAPVQQLCLCGRYPPRPTTYKTSCPARPGPAGHSGRARLAQQPTHTDMKGVRCWLQPDPGKSGWPRRSTPVPEALPVVVVPADAGRTLAGAYARPQPASARPECAAAHDRTGAGACPSSVALPVGGGDGLSCCSRDQPCHRPQPGQGPTQFDWTRSPVRPSQGVPIACPIGRRTKVIPSHSRTYRHTA